MRTEKVFAIIIIIGLLFKYALLWPGGNQILVISISTLSLLYFPFSFYFFSFKGLSNQNLVISILGGMLLSTAVIGVLFKLLYWPGDKEMLLVGLIGSIIVLAISLVIGRTENSGSANSNNSNANSAGQYNIIDLPEKKENDSKPLMMKNYYRNLIIRSSIITFFALVLYFTPKSSLISLQHWDDPEMARLKIRSVENPGNKEYKDEFLKYQKERYRQ